MRQVKAGYDQNAKRKCALKIVNRRKAPKEFQNKFLPRELAVLKKVKHENIVLLYEVLQNSRFPNKQIERER